MKIRVISFVVALSTLPPVAMAQAKDSASNFEGFSLSLGANVRQATPEARESGAGTWSQPVTVQSPFTDSRPSVDGTFSYDRLTSFPMAGKMLPELELGYNWKWSSDFLLGLSVGADFGKKRHRLNNFESNDAGVGDSDTLTDGTDPTPGTGGDPGTPDSSWSVTPSGSYANPDRSLNSNYLGNRIFISIKPSFVVTDSTMVFLKFSYNQARARLGTESMNIRGSGFGVGFETNLSKDWFLRGEVESIEMSGDQAYRAYSVTAAGAGDVTLNGATTNQYSRANLNVVSKDMIGKVAIGFRF